MSFSPPIFPTITGGSAPRCADAGCAGIIVSTHGGRVITSAQSTAEVLPEIRAAVGDRLTVIVDGGIRTGYDIFKVLALGADAAMIGRPFVVAAVGGSALDGGAEGGVEYENFNAADVMLHVNGRSVHPGSAKGRMKNAILLAQEFQALLPAHEAPEATEGYEGFYHPGTIQGNVEQVDVDYIIRDHDLGKFEEKKAFFQKAAAFLNEKYGADTFVVDMKDSYYNMKEKILPENAHLIENAAKAMEMAGVKPLISPIRGGTDGARLSFMGLPCPNLCTGGLNFHGKYEYICIESMEKIVQILLNIVSLYAGN